MKISATTKAASAQTSTPLAMPGMDSGAFMEILLAQLRHQNPLEPMDDKEMIGQMAQLNSLEELQRIHATLQKLVELSQPREG